MQTINLHASPIQTLSRLSFSILLGAFVTFALFVLMHALIKQDQVNISPPQPFVKINAILDIEETKTIVRIPVVPMEELKQPPTAPIDVPDDNETIISVDPQFHVPRATIDRLTIAPMSMDQQTRPVVRVDPKYPADAARDGIEGYVSLSFSVSASGEIVDIKVIDQQPNKVFNRAAKQALRKWRYQPKIENGKPVPMHGMQIRLDFTLAKS